MILTLSVPSKTYLVGEYAVLVQGSALVLNTKPRFELRVTAGTTMVSGIPAHSPADRWLEARRPIVEGWQIEFVDPHLGQGGLGASGAQFVLVHCLTTFLQSAFGRIVRGPDLGDMWRDYQTLSANEGSGGDLLAQSVGQVAQIEMTTLGAKALPWPYPEIGWSLVRTHRKVATHEHLRTLDLSQLSLLKQPALTCVENFGRASAEIFLGSVRDYSQRLQDLGLRADSKNTLIQLIEGEPWCLLAKGCGALGADVVLFFYAANEREKATAFVRKQRLNLLGNSADLTYGLEVRCR